MSGVIRSAIFVLVLLVCGAPLQAKEQSFGRAIAEDKLVEVSKVLAEPKNYLEKTITVKGTIVGVCEKRGCWMELASDAKFEKLRIKVKDGDMVFPMSAKGSQALATGKLNELTLSLEQTKKYLKGIAKRKGETFDPSLVTKEINLYQLVPVGVKILD